MKKSVEITVWMIGAIDLEDVVIAGCAVKAYRVLTWSRAGDFKSSLDSSVRAMADRSSRGLMQSIHRVENKLGIELPVGGKMLKRVVAMALVTILFLAFAGLARADGEIAEDEWMVTNITITGIDVKAGIFTFISKSSGQEVVFSNKKKALQTLKGLKVGDKIDCIGKQGVLRVCTEIRKRKE